MNDRRSVSGRFRFQEVEKAAYWVSVLWGFFDTGLRLGDLLKLDTAEIRGPGPITVVQNKTGQPVPVVISQECYEAMLATNFRRRKKPWGDVLCYREFQRQFAELFDKAGVKVERARSKLLRRTSGSLVERDHPGEGHEHLGNGRDVFLRHYRVEGLTSRARLPARPKLPKRPPR